MLIRQNKQPSLSASYTFHSSELSITLGLASHSSDLNLFCLFRFIMSCGTQTSPGGIDFDHYGLKSGMVFKETTGAYKYLSFQLQMNSRERVVSKIYHSSWILSILEFVIDAKLNYDTTKVWKRVWILEARSENGCGKWNILVRNWVRIWGTGRHTPTKNFEEFPLPPPPRDADPLA